MLVSVSIANRSSIPRKPCVSRCGDSPGIQAPALAQRFLPGREFNVGIIGGNRPRILPLAEVCYADLPPEIPPIMSYAAKWVETSTEYQNTSVICPAEVEPELARQISQTALRAFRAVGVRGYGRVDMRLDETGLPRVLEVNCNPCLDEGLGLAAYGRQCRDHLSAANADHLRAALERPPYDVSVPMFPPPNNHVNDRSFSR